MRKEAATRHRQTRRFSTRPISSSSALDSAFSLFGRCIVTIGDSSSGTGSVSISDSSSGTGSVSIDDSSSGTGSVSIDDSSSGTGSVSISDSSGNDGIDTGKGRAAPAPSRWAEAMTTKDPETHDHSDQSANVRGGRGNRRLQTSRRYCRLFGRPRAT